MLVAKNTTGNFDNVRISKPVSQVMLKGTIPVTSTPIDAFKKIIVTVRHIDANTSHTMELVPQMTLYDLMCMTMVRKGYGIMGLKKISGGSAYAVYEMPIMVSTGGGAVSLNNDRYLTVTVENGAGSDSAVANNFEIYGIESQMITTTRVNKYTRQFLPVGEKQRDFVITTQKALYMNPQYHYESVGSVSGSTLKTGVLTEVMLSCKNNSTPIYTPAELATLAREQNDLIGVDSDVLEVAYETTGGQDSVSFSNYRGSAGTVLIPCIAEDGSQTVFRVLVKTDGTSAYEFFTLDWYDIVTGGYVANN